MGMSARTPGAIVLLVGLVACAASNEVAPKPAGTNYLDDLPGDCDGADPDAPTSAFPPGGEMITFGRYFVRNLTGKPVHLEAKTAMGPLGDADVPPDQIDLILEVSEGSGGHVRPSNILYAFSATAEGETEPRYTGVRNDDWQDIGPKCGRERYLLTLH